METEIRECPRRVNLPIPQLSRGRRQRRRIPLVFDEAFAALVKCLRIGRAVGAHRQAALLCPSVAGLIGIAGQPLVLHSLGVGWRCLSVRHALFDSLGSLLAASRQVRDHMGPDGGQGARDDRQDKSAAVYLWH